jgi:hypothetical protein
MIPWHSVLVIGGILITIAGFITAVVLVARSFRSTCPSGQTYNKDQKKCVPICKDGQQYDPNPAIAGCRDTCDPDAGHFSYHDKKCITCKPYQAWNVQTEQCIEGLNPCKSPFDNCTMNFQVDSKGDVPDTACGWNAPTCNTKTKICGGDPVPVQQQGTSAKYSTKPECSGVGTCTKDDNGNPTGCVCPKVPDSVAEIDKLVASEIEKDPNFLNTPFGKACFGKKRYLSWAGGWWMSQDDDAQNLAQFSLWPTNINSAYPILAQYNGDYTDFQNPWSFTGKVCEIPGTDNQGALDFAHKKCTFPLPLNQGQAFPDPSDGVQCGNRDRVVDPLHKTPGTDKQVIGTRFCASPNPSEGNCWNPGSCTSCCQYQYNWSTTISGDDDIRHLGCPTWNAEENSSPEENPNSNGGVWLSLQSPTGPGTWTTSNRGWAHPSYLPNWTPCLTGPENPSGAGNEHCASKQVLGGQICLGNPADGSPPDPKAKSFQSWCGCYSDKDCHNGLTCNTTTKQCVCKTNKDCSSATGDNGYICKGYIDPTKLIDNDSTSDTYNPGKCIKESPVVPIMSSSPS